MRDLRTNLVLWRVFAILLLVGSIAMVAFWSVRLYSDWRGAPQPHLTEGLLLSIALPGYLLAIASGIGALRGQRSPSTSVFIAGGVLLVVGVVLTIFALGR